MTIVTKIFRNPLYIHYQTGCVELHMPKVDAVACMWGGMTSLTRSPTPRTPPMRRMCPYPLRMDCFTHNQSIPSDLRNTANCNYL